MPSDEWEAIRGDIYLAEPRLQAVERLVEAVRAAGGQIPWPSVVSLVETFLGPRRGATVISPLSGATEPGRRVLRDRHYRDLFIEALQGTDTRARAVGE